MREDGSGIGVVAHDPEHEQESEEAEDVQHQENAFCHGQSPREPDVEGAGDDEEGENQKSRLPQRRNVGILIL